MSLPISVGIPDEVRASNLGYNLPSDAKSVQARILPSNISSITSSQTISTATAAGNIELTFPSQEIRFNIPCMQSPSVFLDTRVTSLTFRMQVKMTNATVPTAGALNVCLRSSANAFFDRAYVLGPNNNTVEDILEYGLLCDTLQAIQLSPSDRDSLGNLYGFYLDPTAGATNYVQGQQIPLLNTRTNLVSPNSQSLSFTVPVVSSVIGVTNDSFLNVGRLNSLTYVLQTTNILPFAINIGTQLTDYNVTFDVILDSFSLNVEFLDIGASALAMVDSTLSNNGVSYSHGTTYRTSTTVLPANTSGTVSLLSGIRGSSVKSLITRFQENAIANNISGKFNSKNPNVNAISFNIGGVKYPQTPANPLLYPSHAFMQLQQSFGNFNSNQFQSSITPSIYNRLSAGGSAQGFTVGTTQDYNYTNGASVYNNQDLFLWGINTEVCPKRGVMSGLNCTSAPIFVDLNIASANSNAHNMIVIAMQDSILIHNTLTGDLQVRL